ncbi:MAG: metallophosphoesterase, partial [Candidatus Marinimicrobia bacterium]|nr:metallophosphoesterase [Candidatus Neomarinimicrobiota bacterium]
ILSIILLIHHLNAQIVTDIYSVQQDATLLGKTVRVIGVVTVSTGIFEPELTFIADPNGGPWSGVAIRDDAAKIYVEEGQKVRVIGLISERSGMTEIQLNSYSIFGGRYPLPGVEKVKTMDIATGSPTAESYEGVFIQVDSVTVTHNNLGYGEWLVDDGSGACRIDDDADYLFYEVPEIGSVISSITGILNYSYENFKLEPRYQSDIVDSDTSSAINIYTIQQNISLNGQIVSTSGMVTAATGIYHPQRTFIADSSGGPWSGILLWDSTATFHANEGDEVRVQGKVFEDNGLTGIVIKSGEILGHNNSLPPAEMINTGDISSGSMKAEIYEGVLIQLSNVFVSDPNLGNGEWLIDDGSGACRVDDDADSLIYEVPSSGSPITSIIGIVNYSDDNYKLEPRYLQDIFETAPIPIGDTLTVIQRPIQTIPALVVPGDVLSIECDADPTTSVWTVELLRGQLQIPLEVQSAVYDPNTLWWTILVTIPDVPFYDLYDLKVTVDGGIEDISRNAVSVIQEYKDDYYFIHITDPHLPTHLYYRDAGFEKDSSEMVDLREVINDINIINPEFVLLTGDLVNEGELEEHQHHRYFTRAQRILAELDVPFFLTSGNHDLGGWRDTPPPDGTARRTWWQFFGWKRLNDPPPGAPLYTQNYSFDYGPVHYIGLEVYINYDEWRDEIYGGTSFTSGQIQWLNDNLAAATESVSQVLFYHYDFKEELDLNALGVDMALWGHTHQDAGDIDGGYPFNISTRAVCDGNRAYRLIRVLNGVLQPSQTISAGWDGNNLSVEFRPANDGTHSSVTAEINNLLNEQFEQARLRFNMPKSDNSIAVAGGKLVQVDSTDVITICYVEVDIQPLSTQTVTISLFSNPFAEDCS